MPENIRSDRRYRFDADRAELWTAITRVDHYRRWWPWLRAFDGATFGQGARWRCVVKPPLPYVLRFELVLVEVVERSTVRARIEGDIVGWALLAVSDGSAGCELRLVSELAPAHGALRVVARLARPVVSYGHYWVLDTGARQFRRQALPS